MVWSGLLGGRETETLRSAGIVFLTVLVAASGVTPTVLAAAKREQPALFDGGPNTGTGGCAWEEGHGLFVPEDVVVNTEAYVELCQIIGWVDGELYCRQWVEDVHVEGPLPATYDWRLEWDYSNGNQYDRRYEDIQRGPIWRQANNYPNDIFPRGTRLQGFAGIENRQVGQDFARAHVEIVCDK